MWWGWLCCGRLGGCDGNGEEPGCDVNDDWVDNNVGYCSGRSQADVFVSVSYCYLLLYKSFLESILVNLY